LLAILPCLLVIPNTLDACSLPLITRCHPCDRTQSLPCDHTQSPLWSHAVTPLWSHAVTPLWSHAVTPLTAQEREEAAKKLPQMSQYVTMQHGERVHNWFPLW